MSIKLSTEMCDYYAQQLEYAQNRMAYMKATYNEWNNAANMEDSPGLVITYAARAGLAHDEYLFWTSVVASLKRKLKAI